MAEERITGVVQWFNNTKGFGFIKPDDESEDLFVHQSDIRSEGFRSLFEGDHVEFVIADGDNGKTKAVDVTGPNGAPLQVRQDNYGGGGGRGFRGGERRNGGGGAGCYTCGDTGHIARDCDRNDRNDRNNGGGDRACYNCGSVGHLARDCMRGGNNNGGGGGYGGGGMGGTSCYRCGGVGHIARDCATPSSGGGGGGCYSCGEVGHIARDCSIEGGRFDGGNGRFDNGNGRFGGGGGNRRFGGGRGGGDGGKSTCFNCGKPGHFARECVEASG